MIKAVIFDADDTLFPEMQYVKSGIAHIAREINQKWGIKCYDRLLELFPKYRNDMYVKFFDETGLTYTQSDIDSLIESYRGHTPAGLSFFSDVDPLLKVLKKRGIKTGIITDGSVSGQTSKLTALKCYELFDLAIVTDGLGGMQFRKPHPKSFEIMRERLGVDFNEMLYVGDNPSKDFAITQSYNILTVHLHRGDSHYEGLPYLNGIKPKFVINSLNEVVKIIDGLKN